MLFAFFYIGTAYLTSYGTKSLELSRSTVLALGLAASVVFCATIAVSGVCSDRLGRRKVLIT
jgi:MFS family permease